MADPKLLAMALSPDVARSLDQSDPFEIAAMRQRNTVKRNAPEGLATRLLDALGTAAYNTAAGPSRLVNAHMAEYQPGASVQDMPQTTERLPEVAMDVMGGGTPFAQSGAVGILQRAAGAALSIC